jgi:twitching motility two-component system response regulator PilH
MSIKTVLVVDDSLTELTHIEAIVTATGCTVLRASTGREALDMARQHRPDIIFMDIIMPEMDGYEATRRLSGDPATKDIPIIFVSSKRQKADMVWGQLQGGKGYITKPFSPSQIVEQIKAFN